MTWYEIANTTALGQNPAKVLWHHQPHPGQLCGTGAVPPCHRHPAQLSVSGCFVYFTYPSAST